MASLLSVFFSEQEKKQGPLQEHPPFFRFTPTTKAKKPLLSNQRFFPVENAARRKPFAKEPLFTAFADLNNRYIAEAKPALSLSIASLLSSSSFIWDRQIFGIQPLQLEAMSEEQRLTFLMQNKNGIIERCFLHLERGLYANANIFQRTARNLSDFESLKESYSLPHELKRAKGAALKMGKRIEGVLKEIESFSKSLKRAVQAKKEAKNSIREISKNFADQNDAQFEGELLSLLERAGAQKGDSLEGLERIVYKLAKKYRRQTLLEASYKEKIEEASDTLDRLKKDFSEGYTQLADSYLSKALKNQKDLHRFLEVHTVFTYFIFNRDIFPQISFEKFSKKSAAKKIFRFLQRKKQALTPSSAFQRMQDTGISGTIQAFLNGKSEQLFSKFKDYRERGVRALTEEEIRRIASVSKSLESRPEERQKFERLEKILEKILLEDQAFKRNCAKLRGELSYGEVIQLQTHMNACLLFTEGYGASDATGLRRSVGFKKLFEAIMASLEGESIELSALKSSEKILDQLEAFHYPPSVLRSFGENVQAAYRSLSLEQLRDIELRIAPLDVEQFAHVKQKKMLLEEIKEKILSLAPFGETPVLSKKVSAPIEKWKRHQRVLAKPAIQKLFPNQATYIRKYLDQNFRNERFSYPELFEALKTFASREQWNLNIFAPSFMQNVMGIFYPGELDLAILVTLHEELREEYHSQLESLERLHISEIVAKKEGSDQKARASVFDNTTLFRYYKKQGDTFSKNYQEADQLYQQFLPLFLTSYLADAGNLNYGKDFFVEKKMEALKKLLPGVERVFGEIEAYFLSKGQQLAKLKDFFKQQELQKDFLEEDFLVRLKNFIKETLISPIEALEEAALMAAVVGMGLLMYTGSPFVAVLGGMAISYFWMTGIKPFVKDIFNLAKESVNYVLGKGYTPSSINAYILDLFKVALQTEIKLSQMQSKNGIPLEMQHLFSNALFLQEELSILRNSRYSLMEFRSRIHMLLPNALKNVNFSTMILNLFFKLNEPLFLAAPSELLKNTDHPLFYQALKNYLSHYKQTLSLEKQAFLDAGHHEEECGLKLGEPSPFKDALLRKAKSGELSLEFSLNSPLHQFLRAQTLNLENTLHIPLEETQIVPPFLTTYAPTHIEAFLETVEDVLSLEERFLGTIRPVILRARRLMTPHRSHLKIFEKGIKTSYFLLRYALDTARRLDRFARSGLLSSEADVFLSSTNETGQSIFLSPLFREVFSLLTRTLELASSSGMPSSDRGLKSLRYIQKAVNRYLKRGVFTLIPLERFAELESAIKEMLSLATEEPQIIFPVLIENERNQGIQLPFAVWELGQEALSNEMGRSNANGALRLANDSKVTYLTNQAIELFFTSQEGRGFALSPMVMNILENALKQNNDRVALKFLSILNARDQERMRALLTPQRYLPDIEGLRQNMERNMARRQGQPLALMPPQQEQRGVGQNALAQPNVAPQPMQQQQGVNGNAPPAPLNGQPEQQQDLQNPQGVRGAPGIQAQNQQDLQQQGIPPQGQQGGPVGVQDQALRPDEQPEQNQNPLMPLMMPGMQNSSNMQQPPLQQGPQEGPAQQVMEEPQQERGAESQGQNYVMVGADGSSGSFSRGGNGANLPQNAPEDPVEDAYSRLAERNDRYAQMPDRPLPPIGAPPNRPYRGPMNMDDFAQYQEDLNAPGFPYGKAAAIGGGLMLGAALLSQLLKKEDKKKK